MRIRLCITAALLAVPLFGCTEASDPLSPDAAGVRSSGSVLEVKEPLATVSSPDIVLLGIQVRSPEFETPLSYQIPLSDGVSFTPLSLPTGKAYELDVRGYDRYGEQTFSGKSALDYVNVGVNERLAVELLPLGKGERAGATFEVYGEERGPEGLSLVIEVDRKEIAEGQSLMLRAYGIDRDGRRIELDPARVHWSIDDPRGGRFDIDPLQPRGPYCAPSACDPWMRWHAGTLVEESRRLRVTVDHYTEVIEIGVIPNGYVDISAGSNVTCAVRRYGDLYCWGGDSNGMLGTGSVSLPHRCNPEFATGQQHCSVRPMAVAGTRMYSSVSVGGAHACAIESNTGAAYCWGQNGAGQLGIPTGSPSWSTEPVAVSPPAGASAPLAFASISTGGTLTCGITTSGDEYCWGYGYGWEPLLGWNGWPSPLTGGPRAMTTSVAAGSSSCRLDRTNVWCDLALYTGGHAYPWTFLGPATTARHMCAIAGTTTWCWGNDADGKLGNGSTYGRFTEVVAPAALNTVATGKSHSCGLAGTLAYCWGSNYYGELGINNLQGGSSTPLQVRTAQSTTPEWVKISTGSGHTCAIDTDGEAWCWGTNYMGQLGNGGKLDYYAHDPRQGVIMPVRTVSP